MAKCGDIVHYKCGQCGSPFSTVLKRGAKPRYCSAACKQRSWREGRSLRYPDGYTPPSRPKPKQPKACGHCGETTTRPRYCSNRCSQKARDKRNGVQNWDERYPAPACKEERECVVCSASFARKTKGRDAGLCCSRRCGFVLRRWRGEQSKRITEAKGQFARWVAIAAGQLRVSCAYCKIPLRHGQRRYCEQCGKEHWRRRSLEYYRASRGAVRCPDCGAEIPNDGSYQRRCEPCRVAAKQRSLEANRRSPATKRSKRIAKARRRAIERGAEAERFDPFEIFDRDSWRCHICGAKTPRRLRGSYDDRAPELDHIIPLAAGGKHTRMNTACSCRKCNIAKGGEPKGQLLLVA